MKVNFNILFLLWAHFTFSINGMTLMSDGDDSSRITFRVYGFEVPSLNYCLKAQCSKLFFSS